MIEVTNEVMLQCMRMAAELVEKMDKDLLVAEFKHMPIETQKAICTQYMAYQLYDTTCEKPKNVE